MKSTLLSVILIGFATVATAAETASQLPRPHYHREAADPTWLAAAVQFHGHLGPWVTAGARLGMAGLRAVDAQGYFDIEIHCEGPFVQPPRSCFLDGLQVGTGATLGKRTLHWKETEEIALRVKNLRSGKTAVVRPTPELLKLLSSLRSAPMAKDVSAKPSGTDEDRYAPHSRAMNEVEALARKVATMKDSELVVIESQKD